MFKIGDIVKRNKENPHPIGNNLVKNDPFFVASIRHSRNHLILYDFHGNGISSTRVEKYNPDQKTEEPSAPPKTSNGNYMILGRDKPKVEHCTLASAIAEAERLVKKDPNQEFIVLQKVACVRSVSTIKTEVY